MATPRECFHTDKGTEIPLLNLRGKEYLEVKWRIVWFREEHPDWSIRTQMLEHTNQHATFRAEIVDREGRIITTGHKTETLKGFPDFLEKAETGSIGRALALIGYGTQFSGDDLDEGERIVDSPVKRKEKSPVEKPVDNVKRVAPPPPPPIPKEPPVQAVNPNGISEAQRKRLHAIKKSIGWTDQQLKDVLNTSFGLTSSTELRWLDYQNLTKFMEMKLSPEEVIDRLIGKSSL